MIDFIIGLLNVGIGAMIGAALTLLYLSESEA